MWRLTIVGGSTRLDRRYHGGWSMYLWLTTMIATAGESSWMMRVVRSVGADESGRRHVGGGRVRVPKIACPGVVVSLEIEAIGGVRSGNRNKIYVRNARKSLRGTESPGNG